MLGFTYTALAKFIKRYLPSRMTCSMQAGGPPTSASSPDVNALPRLPLTVVGAQGILSPRARRQIIERLRRAAPSATILDRHIAFEEALTGNPLIMGNKVMLLTDGPVTYEAIFQVLRGATDHINLETYIFEDDELGQQLAEVLLNKQCAGVQVNIIYDGVGTLYTPDSFFAPLQQKGAQVLKYNPLNPLETPAQWAPNNRDHRKILVVDGKTAFTGGVNISSVYSKSAFKMHNTDDPVDSAWRDLHIKIEGLGVAEFQRLFMETWTHQKGPELPRKDYFPALTEQGDHVIRVIGSNPATASFDVYKTLVSAISHAQEYIHITNAYFVPDKKIVRALKRASKRGVDVKIILPSYSDAPPAFHAGRSHYASLLKRGVKIYERQGVLLHSKAIVIDGVWSTVGSANLDMRSFFHNNEVNTVIVGHKFAREMEDIFVSDLCRSHRITLEEWEQRPFWLKVKEGGARLIEYWL